MDHWNSVRNNYFHPEDGKTPSFISLGHKYDVAYRVIKKILANRAPPGYQSSKPRQLKKLATHLEFIQPILAEDPATREKQRHIPQRIYERLVKERNYDDSSRAVRDLIRRLRRQLKEVYIPLAQPMSQAQV